MTIVQILLCIFLPPVAVFFKAKLGVHFWLNILLSLMLGLPGMIHAFWYLTQKK